MIFISIISITLHRRHSYIPPVPVAQTPAEQNTNITPPTFTWRYEEATALNLDGLPKTNVFAIATYSNGKIETKLVDTPDGSCNDLPDSTEPHAPHSTVTECYAAGFGEYYKVVKGDTSYQVMKKEFEEGSPEYNPPEQQYKLIAEFPFIQN